MSWRLLRTSLFGLVAVPAAVVVVAGCLLWGLSLLRTDDVTWHTPGRMTRFKSSGGGFWFETRPWDQSVPPSRSWQTFSDKPSYPFAADQASSLFERSGFLINTRDYDLLLVAPYWFVAGGAAVTLVAGAAVAIRSNSAVREDDAPSPDVD